MVQSLALRGIPPRHAQIHAISSMECVWLNSSSWSWSAEISASSSATSPSTTDFLSPDVPRLSRMIAAYLKREDEPLPFTPLHCLEFRNAIQIMVHRRHSAHRNA